MNTFKESIYDSKNTFKSVRPVNQTVYNYNDNNNTLFNISFSKFNKERMDHISLDMMMHILNQKTMNESLKKLTKTIYFHPKCPENWKWCVTNLDSLLG